MGLTRSPSQSCRVESRPKLASHSFGGTIESCKSQVGRDSMRKRAALKLAVIDAQVPMPLENWAEAKRIISEILMQIYRERHKNDLVPMKVQTREIASLDPEKIGGTCPRTKSSSPN